MRRVLLLLAVALLVWLWFATDGFEHAPFAGDDDRTGSGDASLLDADGQDADPEAAALRGRARGRTAEPAGALPPVVDLEAAAARGDIHGRVVLADGGAPVPGATVQLVRYPWQRASLLASGRWHDAELGAKTVTAADGTFALPARVGVRVALRVRAEGLAPLEQGALDAGRRLTLEMARGATLIVVAKDEAGAVLAGVELEVQSADRRAASLKHEGTTDAEGRCRFDELLPGEVSIKASAGAEGGVAWEGGEVEAGETTTQEIVLKQGRVIRGVVRDAETKRPIAGARVGMGWTFFKTSVTDEEGRYALGGWTGQGYFDIHVRADGYARAEESLGDDDVLDFELVRGVGVRGRVVDVLGAPLPRALLAVIGSIYEEEIGQTISTAHGRSAADGTFELQDLKPGMMHALVVMKAGSGRHITEFVAPEAGGRVHDLGDITIPVGMHIRGVVLNADGTPRPEMAVRLQGANGDARRFLPEDAPESDDHYGRWEQATSDPEGRFAFADLAPGTYLISAGEGSDVAHADVRLESGRTPPRLRLQFAASHAFAVRVVDEAGKPLEGQYVALEPEGAEDVYEQTGEDGYARFRIAAHVTEAHVEVYYDPDETDIPYIAPDRKRVRLETKEHTIVFRRGSAIRGTLVGPDGKPVHRGEILVLRGGERISEGFSGEDGTFLAVLPKGTGPVDLVYRGDGYLRRGGAFRRVRRPLLARREGVAPDTHDLVLKASALPTNATQRVRVRDTEGKPVVGALVRVEPRPAAATDDWKTDARGEAVVDGLTEQPVAIVVLPHEDDRDRVSAHKTENVRPGATTLEVTLLAPLVFEGTVHGPDGTPMAEVDVYVSGDFPDDRIQAKTDANGRFEVRLPPDLDEHVTVRALRRDEDGRWFHVEATDLDPRAAARTYRLERRIGW